MMLLPLVMLGLSVAVCIWIVAFSATIILEVVAQLRGIVLPLPGAGGSRG